MGLQTVTRPSPGLKESTRSGHYDVVPCLARVSMDHEASFLNSAKRAQPGKVAP